MKTLNAWLEALTRDTTPDFAECCRQLAHLLPLLALFEQTEQDKQWHAEGNVAIHTDMVLKQMYHLLATDARHITGEARQVLILSALLHDIAKPLTTRRKEINGIPRVTATGHEQQGLSYLALKLPELPLAHTVIAQVMALVGYHQMPKLLVVKNQDFGDYLHLALNADLELLYWLEIADLKGRVCQDLNHQLELLEEFKLFALEYNLWGQTDPGKNLISGIQVKKNKSEQVYLDNYALQLLATKQIYHPDEAIAKTYQHAGNYSHLYVMCGISGSGKSSWIAQNLEDFTLISLDDIREELNGKRECQKSRGQVLQLAKTRLKTALAGKRNVVWDATNIRKDFRKVLCDLGRDYHALVTIVAFQVQEKTLRKNNRNRQHRVADEVIDRQISRLQWPELSEAHRMLLIDENGRVLSRNGKF
ncbi:AAA family ATPase [Thalassomonas viridans]|uniref:AAA family ATPase n=1 Tax=Thalassomonas viridans TaxID=137584 RepID=A0AAF0CBM1_9GAMM|nr:AAA family ATPase [Thalassomonas viridans]WDE06749.1 AAA family ATPase [Thalassomonas viridans]